MGKTNKLNYFTKLEWVLWLTSLVLILCSFYVFGGSNYLVLVASLIGATSLIFSAKGNPLGQLLMVIFSILYGIISYSFSYYGEMITYLGMTAPMALFSLIAWLRHPYKGDKSTVTVSKLAKGEGWLVAVLTVAVTVAFYFILKLFGTSSLLLSTLSVATTFVAVYLTFRRSAYYAIAYSLNDIVLVALWILATNVDSQYLSVVVCFVLFLLNDLYGFFNWKRLHKHQQLGCETV